MKWRVTVTPSVKLRYDVIYLIHYYETSVLFSQLFASQNFGDYTDTFTFVSFWYEAFISSTLPSAFASRAIPCHPLPILAWPLPELHKIFEVDIIAIPVISRTDNFHRKNIFIIKKKIFSHLTLVKSISVIQSLSVSWCSESFMKVQIIIWRSCHAKKSKIQYYCGV